MSVIKQEFDIFDIYIEPDRKVITIRQRWKYNWVPSSIFTMWTYEEKKDFHNAVDRVIWQQWSGNYFAFSKVMDFDKKKYDKSFSDYNNKRYIINFDIEWVTTNQHWTVNIEKKFPEDKHRSRVVNNTKEVFLADYNIYDKIGDECNLIHNTVSHEFGHMIGNVSDEYGEDYMGVKAKRYFEMHPNLIHDRFKYSEDYASRMNIGNELRNRFINDIDKYLDKIVPGVNFSTSLTNSYVNSINGRS